MAEKVEKLNMNSILITESMPNVKEELEDDGYIDDKILVYKTTINTSDTELKDHKNDIKHCEISYIKIESSPSEACDGTINNNVKVKDEISVADVKIEFDNELFYCHHCQAHYGDYCTKCGMLVHILNKNILINMESGKEQGMPSNILEIRDSSEQLGVFVLKAVPKGVKFGPFIGCTATENCWRLKGGKFIIDQVNSKHSNWMRHVNPAGSVFEQNLLAFQCDGDLYYRSIREIQTGEELLVHFGEEYDESLNENVEMEFVPPTEKCTKDVFACTLCCLGFSSRIYLAQHKSVCPSSICGKFSTEELTQCQSCNFFMDKDEYLECHRAYCYPRNDRKYVSSGQGNQAIQAKRGKSRRLQMYKCAQCNYRTKFKGDLKSHANKHYEVKMYKCVSCCNKRFKTKESLKAHTENVHVKVEGDEEQKYSTGGDPKANAEATDSDGLFACSTCDFRTRNRYYLKRHVQMKHLKTVDYKCALCDYEGSRKRCLTNHIRTKHLKEFSYKCDLCEYKTNTKAYLTGHVKSKHLEEFDYRCEMCDYKSNEKSQLERHTKTKHLKEYKYKCEMCSYETNKKIYVEIHVKTKHLKEFSYQCELCEYKTNYKQHFDVHVKSKHLKEFDHKCEWCDFETNDKAYLEIHVKSKHLKERVHKCELCEYETSYKRHLERHTKTKHLREFKHGCETCDFKTNIRVHLEMHVKSKHLKEFDYKCDACDFKTNHKRDFRLHVKTKHLKEFEHECDLCDYKTSHNRNLNNHVRTKHLKEFKYKCEMCKYETNTKSNLEKHKQSKHLKEFNYVCEMCAYKTNYKPSLKVHVKTKHLMEFDYECQMCDYKTYKKFYFDRHTKSKHLKESN